MTAVQRYLQVSVTASQPPSLTVEYDWAYERWLASQVHFPEYSTATRYSYSTVPLQGRRSVPTDPDVTRYRNRTGRYSEDEQDPDSEASFLFRTVRVSCLVFPSTSGARVAVGPEVRETQDAIRKTWGRRCNSIHFFKEEGRSPLVKLPTTAKSAFGLLCESLRRIEGQEEAFDWLLVTTEKTFAMPENLRHYVAPLDPSQPVYLGHAMKFWNQVQCSTYRCRCTSSSKVYY